MIISEMKQFIWMNFGEYAAKTRNISTPYLHIVIALENRDWDTALPLLQDIGMETGDCMRYDIEAIAWQQRLAI